MSEPKVDVFMRFYVGDFLNATGDLAADEVGVYCRLLFEMWGRDGRLPMDHPRLARLVRVERAEWDRIWAAIGHFFKVVDGYVTQKRLVEELERAKERQRQASEAGKRSGEARQPELKLNGRSNARSNGSSTPVATEPPTEWATEPPTESELVRDQGSEIRDQGSGVRDQESGKNTDPAAGAGGLAFEESEPAADRIRAVIAHYRAHHPRALTPTSKSKEWRLIRERIREGATVDALKLAIDGYHVNPFHCGENKTGQKHQTLELIFRDASHVTSGIGYAEEHAKGDPVMSERERRGVRASVSWLERSRAQVDPNAR